MGIDGCGQKGLEEEKLRENAVEFNKAVLLGGKYNEREGSMQVTNRAGLKAGRHHSPRLICLGRGAPPSLAACSRVQASGSTSPRLSVWAPGSRWVIGAV